MKAATKPAPQRVMLGLRGEQFSCLHYSGPDAAAAPQLVWVHATGFNAETYRGLLDPLAATMEIHAPDMRGHGFTEATANPAELHSWDVYRDDLVALLEQCNRPSVLAGHSFGAVACIGAALLRPELVRGLVLVEPVLLGRGAGFGLRLLQLLGKTHRFPMARIAARRRSEFASREEAFKRYQGRGAFRTWPDSWLRDYLAGGLRSRPDGGLELCCRPAWESRSFSVTPHDVWPRIARLNHDIALLAGAHDSTCSVRAARRFLRRQPGTRLARFEGATHFLPMEHPQAVATAIREMTKGYNSHAG